MPRSYAARPTDVQTPLEPSTMHSAPQVKASYPTEAGNLCRGGSFVKLSFRIELVLLGTDRYPMYPCRKEKLAQWVGRSTQNERPPVSFSNSRHMRKHSPRRHWSEQRAFVGTHWQSKFVSVPAPYLYIHRGPAGCPGETVSGRDEMDAGQTSWLKPCVDLLSTPATDCVARLTRTRSI